MILILYIHIQPPGRLPEIHLSRRLEMACSGEYGNLILVNKLKNNDFSPQDKKKASVCITGCQKLVGYHHF